MLRVFIVLTIFCVTIGRAQDNALSGWNGTSTSAIGKKGACRSSHRQAGEVAALKASWLYTWGPDRPHGLPDGVEFVPMIWGGIGPKDKDLLRHLRNAGEAGRVKALLGFNEPDNTGQSNLPVKTAVDEWPMLMATGLRLGSPACVDPKGNWMRDFMRQADERHLRVDFVCIHWYGGLDADGFLGMLDHIHKLYGKPLWITEFCPADWDAGPNKPNRLSEKQVEQFMKKVIPAMMKAPYVERFSWYSAYPDSPDLGTSALFNRDGNLTPLGEIYAGY